MVKTFAIHLAAVVSGWVANPLPPRAQAVLDDFLQKRRATEDNATRRISFSDEHKTDRHSVNAPSELASPIAPEILKEPRDD